MPRKTSKTKPKGNMTDRIVTALQRTCNYLMQGVSEEEYKNIGDQGFYQMASDCYLEMYGDDAEATKVWYTLGHNIQEEILKKAFPRYDPPAYQE